MSFPIWKLILIDMLLFDCWDERHHVSAKVCITSHCITASLQAHLKMSYKTAIALVINRVKETMKSI